MDRESRGDYATALRELRARKHPNYDAACFHAQQCIEKYLKGLLQAQQVAFPKTHDLSLLLDACLRWYPLWESTRPELEMLTQYAVVFRYPGETATKAEARAAVDAATRRRKDLRRALGRPLPRQRKGRRHRS